MLCADMWANRVAVVTGLTPQATRNQGEGGQDPQGSAGQAGPPRGQPLSSVAVHKSSATRQETSKSGPDELPPVIRTVLTRIAVSNHVSSAAIARAFRVTVDLPPPMRDVVLASLMTAVMMRGPVADDVEALLRSALAVDGPGSAEVISGSEVPVLMVAGSGKKGLRTLNVSTPGAIVAAAAGARVIKVGSAATSSALGSRDLVRALGLRECRTAVGVRADLAASGFAFVAIEPEIPILDAVYGGRYHVPNPFSFGLAPLASPVRGDITVFGLSHPRVDVAAHVLSRFGMCHADVVSTCLPGDHYLDEIGSFGEVRWCRVREGQVGPVVAEHSAAVDRPDDLPAPCGPEDAIKRTRDLLAGHGMDSHRALVAVNAAHLLVLSGIVTSLPAGRVLAEEILRSGAALATIRPAPTIGRSA